MHRETRGRSHLMKEPEEKLDEVLDRQEARASFRLTELGNYLLGVGEDI